MTSFTPSVEATMSDDDEGSDHDGGPSIPAGVLQTSKRGWAGEELEMDHHLKETSKSDFASVDIKQFQNYQARGVIRQKTVVAEQGMAVRDMATRTRDEPVEDGSSAERKRPREAEPKEAKRRKLEKYVSCGGLREFRKAIEQLLASSS